MTPQEYIRENLWQLREEAPNELRASFTSICRQVEKITSPISFRKPEAVRLQHFDLLVMWWPRLVWSFALTPDNVRCYLIADEDPILHYSGNLLALNTGVVRTILEQLAGGEG